MRRAKPRRGRGKSSAGPARTACGSATEVRSPVVRERGEVPLQQGDVLERDDARDLVHLSPRPGPDDAEGASTSEPVGVTDTTARKVSVLPDHDSACGWYTSSISSPVAIARGHGSAGAVAPRQARKGERDADRGQGLHSALRVSARPRWQAASAGRVSSLADRANATLGAIRTVARIDSHEVAEGAPGGWSRVSRWPVRLSPRRPT